LIGQWLGEARAIHLVETKTDKMLSHIRTESNYGFRVNSVSFAKNQICSCDIAPDAPFSEGRLAAHVPHHEAREAPLDDVLSKQRKPRHILRARGRRTTSFPQLCLEARLSPKPGFRRGKTVVTPTLPGLNRNA